MLVAVAWQRQHLMAVGAPVAARILGAVEDDVSDGGALGSLLPDVVRFGDMPGLRIMAVVHRLALERRAPGVALHLPTMGGTAPAGRTGTSRFADAVVRALADHPDELITGLAHTPQTNETGRSTALRIALSRLPERPVRLVELGASAGLNLRADHLPGRPELEAGPLPPVVARLGCDRDPVDPTSAEGRLLLSSYVWVDDVDRFARLGHALRVAQRIPAEVVRADAADYVEALELVAGTTTVVWHSAMWVYLSPATRERIDAGLNRLGGDSSRDGRLVRASWEWDADDDVDPFRLQLTTWSSGRPDRQAIARGTSHGQVHRLVG